MGMYDSIRVRSPLPNPPAWVEPDTVWQTKELLCELVEFEITADGRLLQLPELGWGWDEKRLPEPRVWDDYHGDLWFVESGLPVGSGLVEYVARFTNGKLSQIREVRRGT